MPLVAVGRAQVCHKLANFCGVKTPTVANFKLLDGRSQLVESGKDTYHQLSEARKSQLQHSLTVGQIQPTDLLCLATKSLAPSVFKSSNKWTTFKTQSIFF